MRGDVVIDRIVNQSHSKRRGRIDGACAMYLRYLNCGRKAICLDDDAGSDSDYGVCLKSLRK